MRENKNVSLERLSAIFEDVRNHHSNDWLLSLEIYELVCTDDSLYAFAKAVLKHLTALKETRPEVLHLIKNGLELLEN